MSRTKRSRYSVNRENGRDEKGRSGPAVKHAAALWSLVSEQVNKQTYRQ